MAKNIYVGNLVWECTADDLLDLFKDHGAVARAQVIIDRETGRSRGFGFVEMSDDSEAQKAIDALNGAEFRGRPLTVNEARPRSDGGGRRPGGCARTSSASSPATPSRWRSPPTTSAKAGSSTAAARRRPASRARCGPAAEMPLTCPAAFVTLRKAPVPQ